MCHGPQQWFLQAEVGEPQSLSGTVVLPHQAERQHGLEGLAAGLPPLAPLEPQ
jgi:hypothetical protein